MTAPTDASLFTAFPAAPASADALLEGLDPEQRTVATALSGPVCVLAGAGTGKTRALTHRIAYGVRAGVLQPATVLAVTFTARAAGEMRGRLRQLGAGGVQARTFHSAALRQLQYFWPRAVGGALPQLVERKIQLVAEAAARSRIRLDRSELRDVTGEIEWAKVTQTVPDDYPLVAAKAGREAPRDPAETARIYAAYEQLKRDRSRIDFEDVLLLTVGVLEERQDVAEQVRSQYQHFVVDEYQDVNPLQQRLLELWLGGRDSLCVVGDASQTIYSFTGASPEYLLGFRTRHPQATVVKLVRDYRSTPQVVHLANGLLAQARGQTAAHRLELVSQTDPGPEPTFTEYPDEPAEAEGAAVRIKELLDAGVRASGIAILYRVNAQSEVYEQALADAGVPYQLRGAERFFERPEIREAGLLLRGAAVGERSGAATRSAAQSGGEPGRPAAEEHRAGGVQEAEDDVPGQVRAVLTTRGWTPQPPAGSGAARDRWESLAALVRLAEGFAAARPGATLTAFVAELDERAATQHAPTVEGVTLASLHAAKGLEWDAVFLVGLTEGTMPISYARTDEQVEEERRLLYVGVTRARAHLAMSWALSRSPGGRGGRRASRFLTGLRPGSSPRGGNRSAARGGAERGAAGRRRRGPVHCRVCGRSLSEAGEIKLMRCEECPSDLDEALYERLREWRSAQARELGQPAYCVFTDKTLLAIAEAVPSDAAELSRIAGVGARKLERFGAEVLALIAPDAGDVGACDGADEGRPAKPSGSPDSDEDLDAFVAQSSEK